MTDIAELSDWVEQLSAELQKQISERAAKIESLLSSGDYAGIRELIGEWEARDAIGGSLRKRYQSAAKELGALKRKERYGSIFSRIKSRASTKSLQGSGADVHSQIGTNR